MDLGDVEAAVTSADLVVEEVGAWVEEVDLQVSYSHFIQSVTSYFQAYIELVHWPAWLNKSQHKTVHFISQVM